MIRPAFKKNTKRMLKFVVIDSDVILDLHNFYSEDYPSHINNVKYYKMEVEVLPPIKPPVVKPVFHTVFTD